ncbi:MAG TPA: replicative DNA helicase [Candidatus Cybelea sp.]|nr:replicative DNA helicase [Candidatus Cybelea sp.]
MAAKPHVLKDLPSNLDAEQAFLGAVMMNNGVVDEVVDFLRPEHFADPAHGRLFDAILQMTTRGETATPVTLLRIVEQDGGLSLFPGGAGRYLVELVQHVVTVRDAADFAREVQRCWHRRELCQRAAMIDRDARTFSADRDVEVIQEAAEDLLSHLSAHAVAAKRRAVEIGEASAETLERIEAAMKSGHSGLSTGLRNLDKVTFGLQGGDLVILAGATSMGKTTLALCVADNVARDIRIGIAAEQMIAGAVLFGSLEMTRDQLVEKFYSERTGISTHRMRSGAIGMNELESLVDAHRDLSDLPFVVDDTVRSVAELRTVARRMQRTRRGLSLVVVDYLQLLDGGPDAPRDNRVAQVGSISRGLKKMALELRVPVIALAQLSRELEKREDKRPILADLRESGTIEQDADLVLFVYRDEYYLRRAEPRKRDNETDEAFETRHQRWGRRMDAARGVAEVIAAKNRHGPLKTARLRFDGGASRFSDLAELEG